MYTAMIRATTRSSDWLFRFALYVTYSFRVMRWMWRSWSSRYSTGS
nr:TPA_asm: m88.6 sORF 1 [Murid betaherpesvirus 1]DBA07844.1 TPA_asm: m88.6 sORF 1 [Murid betaherpesvirus 1]